MTTAIESGTPRDESHRASVAIRALTRYPRTSLPVAVTIGTSPKVGDIRQFFAPSN